MAFVTPAAAAALGSTLSSNTDHPHRNANTLYSASDAFVEALGLENRPVINAELGGMYGWAGIVFDYMNVHPHVDELSWCFSLTTPAAFSRLPGGQRFHSLCKAFFENRSQTFEGLRHTVDFSFAEMTWTGHIMSIPSGATRAQGQVSHTAYDVVGEVFTKLFDVWGRWLICDPELQNAKMVILDDPGPMLLDDISASNIYFTPTKNMRDVAHAAINLGMMPRTLVPLEIKRDKSQEREIRSIQMEFTGLVEWDTLAVKQIARQFLKLLPLYNPDAVQAPAGFRNQSASVAAAPSGTVKQMTTAKSSVSATGTNPGYEGAQGVGQDVEYLG